MLERDNILLHLEYDNTPRCELIQVLVHSIIAIRPLPIFDVKYVMMDQYDDMSLEFYSTTNEIYIRANWNMFDDSDVLVSVVFGLLSKSAPYKIDEEQSKQFRKLITFFHNNGLLV